MLHEWMEKDACDEKGPGFVHLLLKGVAIQAQRFFFCWTRQDFMDEARLHGPAGLVHR